MTDALFTNARLIDPERGETPHGWLLVRQGKIADYNAGDPESLPASCEIIDCEGLCLSPGIIDIGVKVCEPGERHKESYQSASLAALKGGITTIVTRPDTVPAIDTPEALEFVKRRADKASVINVLPMASLTKGRAGQEMTEIGLLADSGAVAFTDCDHVISDSRVFLRALTYAKSCDALVIGHPQDPSLTVGSAATSGKFASLKGLPTVPALAERMGLERDLILIELSDADYHIDQITTAAALPPLQRAREKGLRITAGVSIHHLTLNEFDIANYRTFFKVKPPLRSEDDRVAVVEAVRDGLIDIISSMHTPQDEESKRLPFVDAASGAVALQTLLPASLRLYHSGALDLPTLFRALSLNPAKRLQINAGRFAVGAIGDIILFDPDYPFVLNRQTLKSKCKNTPFDGHKLQGKVIGTWLSGRRAYSGT